MSKVYIFKTGGLSFSHKEDQFALAIAMGCIVLEFGEQVPKGGVVVADTRPKGFVGGRGPNDPNTFMIYEGMTMNSALRCTTARTSNEQLTKLKR